MHVYVYLLWTINKCTLNSLRVLIYKGLEILLSVYPDVVVTTIQ